MIREYGWLMLRPDQLPRIDRAAVGVLGHAKANGEPNAVAVTPYVVNGELVVTSTLALVQKAAATRRDPRVTLTAGGVSVVGTATVEVDRTAYYFDTFIRAQELRKYPPARSLLTIPFHRRLLPWYVGRVVIRIQPEAASESECGDGATVTVVDTGGQLRTWSVPRPGDLTAEHVSLPSSVADGAALLLVHEEDADMKDLRQMAVRGVVRDGVLARASTRGSLARTSKSAIAELQGLRQLARAAKANRASLATWPQYQPDKETPR